MINDDIKLKLYESKFQMGSGMGAGWLGPGGTYHTQFFWNSIHLLVCALPDYLGWDIK